MKPTSDDSESQRKWEAGLQRFADRMAQRDREQWPEKAPKGYRVFDVPELVIPAHRVVIEWWNDTEGPFTGDVFVAGDPDEGLQYSGSTPLEALTQYEYALYRAQADIPALYTGYKPPLDDRHISVTLRPDTFTWRGRRWLGKQKGSEQSGRTANVSRA